MGMFIGSDNKEQDEYDDHSMFMSQDDDYNYDDHSMFCSSDD